jgi:peptidoglycan/xylan/chitin deacetylase (PgdA/CDA1 family)
VLLHGQAARHNVGEGRLPKVLSILMYHEVSPVSRPGFAKYVIGPREFLWQIQWLKRMGFTAITLDQLCTARLWGGPFPKRPVLITFDDGFADSARYAAPVLLEHGFTATYFVVTDFVGRSSNWLMRERRLVLPMMAWSAMRELQAHGIRFGAHSRSHPRLTELRDAACREELVGARHALEDGLGEIVQHLAYPFGCYDARVRDLAEEAGYRTACTTVPGRSGSEDLLQLRRVPVNGGESRMNFISRLLTGRTFAAFLRAKISGSSETSESKLAS